MSNERLENPGPSPLTEGLKRKRGRPRKQPQVSAYRPQSLPEVPRVNLVGSAGSKEQGKARFCVVNIKAIQESSSMCALGYQPLVSEELQCPHGKLLRPGVEWEELLRSLLQSEGFWVSQPSASAPVGGRKATTGCSYPVPGTMVGILATHPFPQAKM